MTKEFEVDGLVLVDQGDMHWIGRILEISEDNLLLTEFIDPNDDYDGGQEYQKTLCTPVKIISLKERWRLESCETCANKTTSFCYNWSKEKQALLTCAKWEPK